MEVGRRYRVALVVTVLAAGGYVGVTQFNAAQDRADAREEAAASVEAAVEAKSFQAKAEALLAKLPHPVGFTPTQGVGGNPCGDGIGVSLCYLTAMSPQSALDTYLEAVHPLGLVIQKNHCMGDAQLSARARAIFGKTPPCNAYGELDGLPFSATSFPQLDHAHSTRGHTVFAGSRVSFSFSHF